MSDRPSTGFHVSVVQSWQSLPASARTVLGLLRDAGAWHVSLEWFENLHRNALGTDDLRIYLVHDVDGQCLCVLPMLATRSGFGGRRLTACANYYSALFEPAMSDNTHAGVWDALARAWSLERPRWSHIDLKPCAEGAVWLERLSTALTRHAWFTQAYFCFGNWTLDVAGRSFLQYRDGLPSRQRHTLERKWKKWSGMAGATITIVSATEEIETAVAAWDKVYGASWKEPEPHPDFMPGLLRLCAAQGWLRLALARIDGEPIAAQFWIVSGGKASIYKLAYDEDYKHLSIGSLLTASLMQYVIDTDRVTEVDYLSGDDAYKRDWMSVRRERWGMQASNLRTLAGLVSALRSVLGACLRRYLPRRGTATKS